MSDEVCPRCRYPMTGLPSATCPECGLGLVERRWSIRWDGTLDLYRVMGLAMLPGIAGGVLIGALYFLIFSMDAPFAGSSDLGCVAIFAIGFAAIVAVLWTIMNAPERATRGTMRHHAARACLVVGAGLGALLLDILAMLWLLLKLSLGV